MANAYDDLVQEYNAGETDLYEQLSELRMHIGFTLCIFDPSNDEDFDDMSERKLMEPVEVL